MNTLCDLLSTPQDVENIKKHLDENIENIKKDVYRNMNKYSISTTPFGYERRCCFRNDDYEVLCLVWESSAASPIHNHAENGCVMKIMNGELSEDLFEINGKKISLIDSRTVSETSPSQYINNTMGVHKISNNSEKTTYSLHIYSPPYHKVTVY